MIQKVVIIGGSHAFWEINELINDINKEEIKYEIVGILDDNIEIFGKEYNGIKILGPIEKAKDFSSQIKFVFAIGSYNTRLIRAEVLKKIDVPDSRFETLIHPTAKIFSNVEIGYGCIIHYGTVIFNHTYLNSFCVISANCVIGVGNLFGIGALLGSNITTTTGVKIASFAFIGSSTTIAENIEIGPGAMVGIGSLILKNIKPGYFVLGLQARVIKIIEIPQNILMEWNFIKQNFRV